MSTIQADLKDTKILSGDSRCTELHDKVTELPAEDIIPDEEVVLTLTRAG